MKNPHSVKGARKVVAWTLATALAFGLMPTSALANPNADQDGGIKHEVFIPEQALQPSATATLNSAEEFNRVNPLYDEPTISKNKIDATKPISLPPAGKRTVESTAASVKYYKVTLVKASKFTISVTGLNNGLEENYRSAISLYALNKSKNVALAFDTHLQDLARLGTTTFNKTWYLPRGTYYVQVNNPHIATNDTFVITTKRISYDETFSEAIPGTNEIKMNARNITLGKKYTGVIATSNKSNIDQKDMYMIRISYATSIRIKTTAAAGLKGNHFFIRDKKGNPLLSGIMGNTINFPIAKGTYYLDIDDYTAPQNGGQYTFSVTRGPKLATRGIKQVTLKWAPVPGADNYEIWESYDTHNFKRIKTVSGSATNYTVGIPPHTTHYYKIRYTDGATKSPWSTIWKASRLD